MNEALRNVRVFPRRHPVWTSLLALFIFLFLLLAFFNWNWARGPVQRLVSAAIGREFRIDGNLDVDYFPLTVHAQGLYLANAAWSDEPAMARVQQLDMRVRFWPLLVGNVVLPELSLQQPRLRLERNAQGVGNWVFGTAAQSCDSDDCASRVRILQLLAHGGLVEFREPTLMTSLDVNFDSAKPAREQALAPLVLRGKGTYRAAAFDLNGQVDSPLALQGKPQPYSVDVTVSAGETHARAYGTLAEPLQTENVAVNLELSGADLEHLYDLTGIVLPGTPPYQLKGRLTVNGMRVGYHDFAGKVGDSDLSGDVEINMAGKRPRLTAKLESQRIDFDDLAGFIGGTPDVRETASAEQKKEKQALQKKGKVLPDTPIHLDRLRAMDADVQLTASRVDSPRLPLEGMQAHLKLVNGRLLLDPLNFGAAGGRLVSTVLLDARGNPAQFGIIMNVEKLQLPKLLPKVKALQDSVGTLGGNIDLRGQGNSAASVLASSSGSIGVIMGQGKVSNLLLEVAGLDIAESLKFLIGKDREVRLRCAYADFAIADGVATARAVGVDTTDTALLVRGDFSFADESLDLKLRPRPKDFSPVSIRVPIAIDGTFAKPSIHPEGGPLILRSGAVAALASIAPPLALLGLIETGPGHDADCGNDVPPTKEKKRPSLSPPGPRSLPVASNAAHAAQAAR